MKSILKKIINSESKIDDIYSLLYSILRFGKYKGKFIKSSRVYYKNQGRLMVDGRLFFGFFTNRMSLSPNGKGVFRVYKQGNVNINGFVRIARDCKIYVAGKLTIGNGTYINPNTIGFL